MIAQVGSNGAEFYAYCMDHSDDGDIIAAESGRQIFQRRADAQMVADYHNRQSHPKEMLRMSITTADQAYEAFDAYMNEMEPDVSYSGVKLEAARVLWAVDKPGYREAFKLWLGAMRINPDTLKGDFK